MWIRPLSKLDVPRLEALILALPPEQRRLRFCYSISTEGVCRYVAQIDWRSADVLGAFVGMELIGALELVPTGPRTLEGALEVHPDHQGQGVARRLVERGILHAKIIGKSELQLNCLGENTAMKQIARSHGMELTSSHGDVESRLPLTPAAPVDYVVAAWRAFKALSASSRAARLKVNSGSPGAAKQS